MWLRLAVTFIKHLSLQTIIQHFCTITLFTSAAGLTKGATANDVPP